MSATIALQPPSLRRTLRKGRIEAKGGPGSSAAHGSIQSHDGNSEKQEEDKVINVGHFNAKPTGCNRQQYIDHAVLEKCLTVSGLKPCHLEILLSNMLLCF